MSSCDEYMTFDKDKSCQNSAHSIEPSQNEQKLRNEERFSRNNFLRSIRFKLWGYEVNLYENENQPCRRFLE